MTERTFFDERDYEIARRYVEKAYQPGAFDPVIGDTDVRDAVATASIDSTRDYMLQSLGTRSSAGKEFRIFPAIIKTMSPNAFAGARDGLHVCGLHAGLFAMVHEVCFLAMAQSNVFEDVGNPELEASPRYPHGENPAFWLIDHTIRQTEISQQGFANSVVPKCPDRYLFAIHLTLMMLRSVWFHETAHCLNGHVEYLHNLNTSIQLNEVSDPRLGWVELDETPLVLPFDRLMPALELDADRTALYWAYRTQFEDKENISGIATHPKQTRLEMALFTSLLMTFLFEQINARVATSHPATHPDSMTRLHDMVRTVAINLAPLDQSVHKTFKTVLNEITTLASALSGLLTGDLMLAGLKNLALQAALNANEDDLQLVRSKFANFGYR